MQTRRTALKTIGLGLGTLAAPAPLRLAFARAATDRRLVVLLLRGGMDALAAVPPLGDPHYGAIRGELAFGPPDSASAAFDLDGHFGLHPSLGGLYDLYRRGELAIVHAAATPYRGRSHFDGQDLLELGTARLGQADDGWLGRALDVLEPGGPPLGLAVGQTVPLILRGSKAVGGWSPERDFPDPSDEFLEQVAALYETDRILAKALADGLRERAMSEKATGTSDRSKPTRIPPPERLKAVGRGLGQLMAADDGPRIAVLDAGGWDTHLAQGLVDGRLATSLSRLADALLEIAAALGPEWRRTVVIVASEFGRTAAPNGSGGTDHGTGGAVLVAGGAVDGGRVVSDWPGLAPNRLLDERDLMPTIDSRAVFKGVLAEHLGLKRTALERTVFPDSAAASPLRDLIRT